ncbi:MAG: M67 family metallopeptidase [Chloroflexota bacterium]|nr:M67 family metallopeptidase [Chloroflexota bacterium]
MVDGDQEGRRQATIEAAAHDRPPPPVQAPSDLGVGIGAPVFARTTARVSAALLQQLIDWARDGVPNEACGIIAGDRFAGDGGQALRFHALTNRAASPSRYLIDPDEQLRVMTSIDDADEVVWGIFHSHVASPAEPSGTDIELAFYPGSLYLICSLADPLRPVVRAWTIEGGRVEEVTLEVG